MEQRTFPGEISLSSWSTRARSVRLIESDRAQLSEIVQRVRDGRLRTNIGTISTLDDAMAVFNPTKRVKGKTISHVRPLATHAYRFLYFNLSLHRKESP